MSIVEEFKNITGLELPSRRSNYLFDRIERKDPFSNMLAVFYFSDRAKFNKLKIKVNAWLRNNKSEEIFALAGYIYYIAEDFKKAKHYFQKAIAINPGNLDNWVDLAFALRHDGEEALSNGIFFNYDHVIYYYRYLGLVGCSYAKLKSLIMEITKRVDAV